MRRHIVTGNATGADAGEAIMWGESHTDPSCDEKFFVRESPAVFRRWQSSKPCPCILTRAASDTSLIGIRENLSEEGAAMGFRFAVIHFCNPGTGALVYVARAAIAEGGNSKVRPPPI